MNVPQRCDSSQWIIEPSICQPAVDDDRVPCASMEKADGSSGGCLEAQRGCDVADDPARVESWQRALEQERMILNLAAVQELR
jgi:hypothetical protein